MIGIVVFVGSHQAEFVNTRADVVGVRWHSEKRTVEHLRERLVLDWQTWMPPDQTRADLLGY